MNGRRTILLFLAALILVACSEDPRRDNIEHAMRQLLPATRVAGRTYTPATVEQRMNEYRVPAVSVAVIENGRVAWARSYGLADVDEKRQATTRTLFQA